MSRIVYVVFYEMETSRQTTFYIRINLYVVALPLQKGDAMSIARAGSTVKVSYVGTLEDGAVFDKSQPGKDLQFTLGARQVIPGFDSAVTGMEVGETKTVFIEPEQAYGHRNQDAVVEVSRSRLPDSMDPVVGQRLKATGGEVNDIVLRITKVKEETVILDANHPLAGKKLTFEITLNEIVKERE